MSICLNDLHVFRPFVYVGTIQQDFTVFPLITIEIFSQSPSCTCYSYMETQLYKINIIGIFSQSPSCTCFSYMKNSTIQNKDNKGLPHIEKNRLPHMLLTFTVSKSRRHSTCLVKREGFKVFQSRPC